MKRRILSLATAFVLMLSLVPSAFAEAKELTATAEAKYIQKYGNVTLSLKCEELKAAGYEYGDVLNVSFLDRTLELPLCSNYSDVDSGSPAVFARAKDEYVLVAINMGDFATTYGIAVKTTHEDKTFEWNYAEGVTGPVVFTLSLKEAGGYYGEYLLHQLAYTNDRADYPDLTDAQFANFRAVRTPGMGYGTLFRTSSPVNPKNGRNTYADALLRAAGVTVVMNLADDASEVKAYEGYEQSYYASTKYIALNMGVDFAAEDFRAKLAEGLRFFAENPGVYAVHCTEGKDRAGFVAALLESLMGADYDAVVGDYMTTFYNYYGVTPADERYASIANSNIVKTLSRAFGVSDLKSADLAACAAEYVKSLGLSDAEVAALRENLAVNHVRDTSFFTPIYHTELRYDEIAYEHIDTAPLLKEIDELRALFADAKNAEEFGRRVFALADEIERMQAMLCILDNMTYADAKNEWAVSEFQKVSEEETTTRDAFDRLIRDALNSPCASVLTACMDEKAVRRALAYQDMTDEEIKLCTRVTELGNEYQSLAVDPYTTTTADGVEWTGESAIEAYLAGTINYDEYLEIANAIYQKKAAVLGVVYLEIVDVSNQIAKLHGYDNYAEYAYPEVYHRDYSPADAAAFGEMVKKYIAPLRESYNMLRKAVDQNEMPLGAAYSGEGMFDTLFPYFAQISDELLESAAYTYEHGAYDVDPAPNKTGTAYSMRIPYYEMPYYFNNASGAYDDLNSTIHELGHNNQAYWQTENWNDASLTYDTAEVHSQGLEVLMLPFYGDLFGSQSDEMTYGLVGNMLDTIVFQCMLGEFEHEVFTTPDLTLTKVNQIFRKVCGEYGYVDADDPRTEMYSWTDIPHFFQYPMYVISYATSAVGALAFWERSQEDYFTAVDDYLRFTALPNAVDFGEAFEAVGMADPMSEESIRRLAQSIHEKLMFVKPFTDVYVDSWFAESVMWTVDAGIMRGVSSDAFAPNDDLTNEQCMTVLARMNGKSGCSVDEGVAWAVENGVSDGANRTDAVTREQFVTMLYRCAVMNGTDAAADRAGDIASFDDASDVSEEAVEAMRWAVETGVIRGMDGRLAPQGRLTRAQFAAILFRVFAG
ncbi:MAG: S-layer homology domain-containing protein [Oscillospiraceae bacterium]|nr:S-layer homology domain-containing protein [Oscillospiraceae bacterium]